MSEDLTKDLQDKANLGGEKPKKFNFNFQKAASAQSFTPSFTPGAYSAPGNQFAFQDFSNYAKAPSTGAPPAATQPEGMSLDQFKNQGDKSSLNTRVAPAKKVLSVGGAKKTEPKVLKVGGTNNAPAQEPTQAKQASPSPKVEPKAEVKQPKEEATSAPAKESKPAPASKKVEDQTAEKDSKIEADAVVKDQEKLDQAVVEDMFGGEQVKEHLSIIFMGHVDAGKSTMGGNILYLTGSVDKRTIEKYEREAQDAGRQGWYLSWVMDTNREERNEGKTIEVGRAVFETDKRRFTILDAPGHKMYVPSMIGGASQADAGILVISARKGEYETGFEKGGQTREHAILAKTQGVERLVVVVNKMDDPTVEWSKERYDECIKKLGVFLKGTGYQEVIFMPVSGYTGAGLKDRVPKKECPWYDGPSLLEYLDNIPLEHRKISAPFMLPVSSKAKELGTVVEGKIESGSIKKGASVLMMPNRVPVEVSAIFNESEAEIPGAICGEQVKLKLKGIDEEDIQLGFVLTSSKNPIKAVTRFEAQVAFVEIKSIMTAGFSCVMHVHTAVEEVTFVKLLHKLEKGTNRKSKKPPAYATKGMKIIAEIEAASPLCIEEFAKLPQLGRFTLRDQGQTIAIGKVTKILD